MNIEMTDGFVAMIRRGFANLAERLGAHPHSKAKAAPTPAQPLALNLSASRDRRPRGRGRTIAFFELP